jgi:hypothetical protein
MGAILAKTNTARLYEVANASPPLPALRQA